ncbi:hypothetical protein M408DRAFT_331876 [Serendipita vermifera MAFF 305830]|uniref:EthD domain-containing protein n=1 Tax=Serendipita vermifera MAFF 305830 TaxID=933852 RepID=A0A0C3AHX0_SERVB|nr:hypothetical protein M408DRAFT_331876 [Serendipita vermifera MAFF 305830]
MAQAPPTGPVRVISFFQKNSSVSDEEFRSHHEGEYREKAIALFKKHNGTYCSQTFTTSIPAEAVGETAGSKLEAWPYSLIITADFPSVKDAKAFWEDPEYAAATLDDATVAAQGSKMSVVFGREEVLIG